MPTYIDVPRRSADSSASDDDAVSATSAPDPQSLAIAVVFHGVAVTEATEVLLRVPRPAATRVGAVRAVIGAWCAAQLGRGSDGAAPASAVTAPPPATATAVKLNLGGVTLTDDKEMFLRAVARASAPRVVPKLYVSGVVSGTRHQHGGVTSSAATSTSYAPQPHEQSRQAGAVAGVRHARGGGAAGASGGGASGGPDDMTPEMADAVANMLSSNPQMIDMMLASDPAMREMLQQNPEVARMLRNPATIRDLIRSQATRDGRRQQETEQRAALAFIQNHPDGQALIERAMGGGLGAGDASTSGGPTMADVAGPGVSAASAFPARAADGGGGGLLLPLPPGSLQNAQQQRQLWRPDAAVAPQLAMQQQQQLKIRECVATLTNDMGFADPDVCTLAATEAGGDLEAAIALLEQWQDA